MAISRTQDAFNTKNITALLNFVEFRCRVKTKTEINVTQNKNNNVAQELKWNNGI